MNKTRSKNKKPDNQEKLYTQDYVDSLLNKLKLLPSSRKKRIDNEKQKANAKSRYQNKVVESLVRKSNRILVSISTHAFPIDLIPDIINVEEGRVTIIKRHLFSSEIYSFDIKDISNVFIQRTFLFSQLIILAKTYQNNEIKVNNLRTKEAVFIRRIIEGLRVFERNNINTSRYSKEELISKLEELSTTDIVT